MAKERTELLHKTASLVDPLTGIANRRAFMETAGSLAHTRPAAVLVIDLDHFKQINDAFGHGVGDRVLQVFAETAAGGITPGDLVARLGGEEFAVLLDDCDSQKAVAVAERIRTDFATFAAVVDGCAVNGTVSVGVALCEHGLLDVSAALAQADQALYHAKQRGRNRVEIASVDLVLRLDSNTPSLRIDALVSERAA